MAAAPTDQPAAFGVALRRCRLAAGLSQEELAERANLSRRGISDLERGTRRAPYPATVRQLAEALGLDEGERATLHAAARHGAAHDGAARSDTSQPSSPNASTGWTLQLREASGDERAIPLGHEALTLGRDATCAVVVSSPFVSRQHVRIELGADGPRVSDLGSRNGTYLNGERLDAPGLLRHGDVLTLGDVQIECRAELLNGPMTRTLVGSSQLDG
jgi:transcriptional regulator with XRE-family HTH domain